MGARVPRRLPVGEQAGDGRVTGHDEVAPDAAEGEHKIVRLCLGLRTEVAGDVGAMGGKGDGVLIRVCLLGAGEGRGEPVRWAVESSFGVDVIATLLLAVGASRHVQRVGAGEAVGLEVGGIAVGGAAVGIGGEDGVDLGCGEVGELDLEPFDKLCLGVNVVPHKQRAFVGVEADEKLLTANLLGGKLLAGEAHDVGMVGDGPEGPVAIRCLLCDDGVGLLERGRVLALEAGKHLPTAGAAGSLRKGIVPRGREGIVVVVLEGEIRRVGDGLVEQQGAESTVDRQVVIHDGAGSGGLA